VNESRHPRSPRPSSSGEVAKLRLRLAGAEEALRAIRTGEVDSVVVPGRKGPQVFTLEGAEHSYRVLIESMNEGAVTLTREKTILYANQCFARMVKCPLEQVMGGSFRRFISPEGQLGLSPLLKGADKTGAKIQVLLNAGDGTHLPVQISIRMLAKNGFKRAPIGLVVTDLSEARRTEKLLRALTSRVVQVQEDERGRLALELHNNITQLLCAILFRSKALADSISPRDGLAKMEAAKLRELLGQAAAEVERITRDLRPGVLDQLGLGAVLRATSTEFTDRTGVAVELAGVQLLARLPAAMELTLYRILQESLKNVEKHARAGQVLVHLAKVGEVVQLRVKDDGVGFDPEDRAGKRKANGDLGLLGMRERATSAGGALKVKSNRRGGTEIEVRIPLPVRLGPAQLQVQARRQFQRKTTSP